MLNKSMRIIEENSLEYDAIAAHQNLFLEETAQDLSREYFQRTHSSTPHFEVESVTPEQISEQLLHDFYRGLV